VFTWEGGPALVQTVDFFTPIVDDPFIYGQIAAANSLSDVYAMGGRPLTALAIAGFPKDGVDTADIAAVFRGGYEKLREAGTALLGGHTVQDSEIKFGYAVTGAVNPARLFTNAGALAGDVLYLTKPIGTGVVGTAIKAGNAPPDVVERAVGFMTRLNKAAAEALGDTAGVHACTDITGFGLVGHAMEMAAASGATLQIRAEAVPVIEGVLPLVSRHRSGGMSSNRTHFGPRTALPATLSRDLQDLVYDPQTSGGLLVAVSADQATDLEASFDRHDVSFWNIGAVVAPVPGIAVAIV
jgi:selenide, water dikinase